MIGIFKGMRVTIKHIYRRAITLQYPDELSPDLGRFRGALYLKGILEEKAPPDGALELPPPCTAACPAGVDARGYLNLVAQGKYYEGYLLHLENNPLPATFGRICFHPCEVDCRRADEDEAISIRDVKRFMADEVLEQIKKGKLNPFVKPEFQNGTRVAIIGSGPAGLACAYYLAKMGYSVTIFEKLPIAGGMLAVGIPSYRLPTDVLQTEIDLILQLGVEMKLNTEFGSGMTLDDIFEEGFQAVFMGVGAHVPQKLGIEGEDLEGVEAGEDFLRRHALGENVNAGDNVVIIGGGNTAIDCARTAKRLGAKATILYRRGREEMPAHEYEIKEAEVEDVGLELLAAPTRFIGDNGRLKAVECVRMELGAPDASGRRRPVPIEGSEFRLPASMVLKAISRLPSYCSPDGQVTWFVSEGIELSRRCTIEVDPFTGATSRAGVFAGGDAVLGAATAVEAVAAGRRAALGIDAYLGQKEVPVFKPKRDVAMKTRYNPGLRAEMPTLSAKRRSGKFDELELGFAEEVAVQEAERCLSCYSQTCIGCKICSNSCPTRAISIVTAEDGARRIESYEIDHGLCSFCGICVESCPTKALGHSHEFDYACGETEELVFDKERLLREVRFYEGGKNGGRGG